MADTLLSSYPDRVLTHVLGHDVDDLVGKLAVEDISGGGATVLVSDTPPSTVTTPVNSLWWESNTGIMYILYDDGSSVQWVAVGDAVSGDVLGPPSSTDDHIALFDGATGKLLKDSGIAIGDVGGGGDPGGSVGQLQYNNTTFGGLGYYNGTTTLRLAATSVAQGFEVYKTTDSNATPATYERGVFDWTTTANVLTIGSQKSAGTGGQLVLVSAAADNLIGIGGVTSSFPGIRRSGAGIHFVTADASSYATFRAGSADFVGGLDVASAVTFSSDLYLANNAVRIQIGTAGDVCIGRTTTNVAEIHGPTAGTVAYVKLNGVVVASLPAPSATYAGARGTVTDCTVTTFYTIVDASNDGGANVVPVFCDGTNWRIG